MIRLLQLLMFMLQHPGDTFFGRELALKHGFSERNTYYHLNKLVEAGFLIRENKNYKVDPDLKKTLLQKFKISMLN